MADDRLEIEIALRDAMSSGLRAIARELDAQARKARESNAGLATSFGQITVAFEKTGKTTQSAASSINAMGGLMSVMGKQMLGPLGIVAGFVAVAKTLKNFAASNQSVRAMAHNAGLTRDQFNILAQAVQRGTGSLEAGRAAAGKLGAAVQRVVSDQWTAPIFNALNSIQQREVANAMATFARAGKHYDAIITILREFERQTPKNKRIIADAMNMQVSELQAIVDNINKFQKEYIVDLERLEKITWLLVGAETVIYNIWDRITVNATKSFLSAFEGIRDFFNTGVGESLKRYKEGAIRSASEVTEIFKHPSQILGGAMHTLGGGIPGFNLLPAVIRGWVDQAIRDELSFQSLPKKAGGGIVTGPSIAGEAGPELVIPLRSGGFSFGGGGGGGGINLNDLQKLSEIEEGSSRLLSSIAEVLHRMEDPYGFKKFGEGGTVDSDTLALLGEAGREVVSPSGTVVDRPTKGILPAGSTVIPENALRFIKGIGRTETGFSAREAIDERLNYPRTNRNVAQYGPKAADYGYYQMNAMDVAESIKLGADPEVARHLSGGMGRASSIGQQTGAVYDYLQRRYPGPLKNLIDRDDFEGMRKATQGKWFGLKDNPALARAAFAEAGFPELDAERRRIDTAIGGGGSSGSQNGTVSASVDFSDMRAGAPVPFLPLKPTTSSQAALAASATPLDSNQYVWGY